MLGEVVSMKSWSLTHTLSFVSFWLRDNSNKAVSVYLLPLPLPLLRSHPRQDLYADPPPLLNPINPEQIEAVKAAQEKESEARKIREQRKARVMKAQKGFCEEGAEGDFY